MWRSRVRKWYFKPFNIKYLRPFLFIMAMLFIGSGVWQFIEQQSIIDNWIVTTWMIIWSEVRKSTNRSKLKVYTPIIRYFCWEREITTTLHYSSSTPPNEGAKIDIFCLPDNPKVFIINSFSGKYLNAFMFLIVGIIMLPIPLIRWRYALYFFFYERHMKNYGILIQSTVTAIIKNDNFGINGICRHYFISEYRDPDTDQLYTFRSRLYRKILTRSMKKGMLIDTYVLPHDYTRYYIDDSFLYKKR